MLLEHKVIRVILLGYSSNNTTILSSVYNLSTTCFGRCCCGHQQVGYNLSEKLYRYDITEQLLVLVLVRGRDLVYSKLVGVCVQMVKSMYIT